MAKAWQDLITEPDEKKFDVRLVEKKIEENFLTNDEAKKFQSSVEEEKDFAFTSMDEIQDLSESSGE